MENKKLLGFYDYTVILTYMGMLSGFVGITLASNGQFREAVICLMFSGVCDMFDGAVANTKKRTAQEKKFGIQIDSLSDLICFGVLPAMLVYKMNESTVFSLVISAVYTLCALIRLAYFNVCEEERQSGETGARKVYQGLPVTTSALVIPAVYVFAEKYFVFIPILMAMGALFLLPFKLRKPKLVGKAVLAVMGAAEMICVLTVTLHTV